MGEKVDYKLAVETMIRSLASGKQKSGYVAFDTFREQRPAYNETWRTPALSHTDTMIIFVRATRKLLFKDIVRTQRGMTIS